MLAEIHCWKQTNFRLLTNSKLCRVRRAPPRWLTHSCWGEGSLFFFFFFNPNTSKVSCSCLCSIHCKSLGYWGETRNDYNWLHRCLRKNCRNRASLQSGLSSTLFAGNFSKCPEEGARDCCHESCKEGNDLVAESILLPKSTGRLSERCTSEIHAGEKGASWEKREQGSSLE